MSMHRCGECGATSPQWVGRCPECGTWGSLSEPGARPVGGAVPLASVDAAPAHRFPTGVDELDRVVGGGLVPGSVTLLGGEPGIGKSTLLLQVLASIGGASLLVSAEESAAQVRLRASRLGPIPPGLMVLASTDVGAAVGAVRAMRPAVCVIDSIQAVHDPAVGSTPGSVTQVRSCAQALVGLAKELGVAVVLVGHVTKDGSLAGPRTLEHLVDTVLSFEGDRHHALRLLRAVKHRFGATGELGLFEMTDVGMEGVADPGALFLGDRRPGAAGSAVVTSLEGRRPLLVEVQALVSGSGSAAAGAGAGWGSGSGTGVGRRSAQGVDGGRLEQLLAVLDRQGSPGVARADVFVSAVGGVRLSEPAADLGLALAVTSSWTGHPLPGDLVAIGEVGLGGEIRRVPHAPWRLAEAARLGFRRVLLPPGGPPPPAGLSTIEVSTVGEAVAWLRAA